VDFRGGPERAGPVYSCECEAPVLDQESMEAQVARHADGSFHGIVGDHPSDDDEGLLRGTEPSFEAGTNEGAIGPLGNDGFAGQGLHFGLELVSRLAGPIVRRRLR